MRLKELLFTGLLGLLFFSCTVFNPKKAAPGIHHDSNDIVVNGKNSVDSLSLQKPKRYGEVITKRAITDSGLFIVHKVDEKYYFEIPASLLNQDILIVSRISKGAANFRFESLGFAGDQINETIIKFSTGYNNKLFVRKMWNVDRTLDSTENGLYKALINSNLQPIVASFSIKSYGSDSSIIVDVTDWLTSENTVVQFKQSLKIRANIGAFQKDKSFVEDIKSFPQNVEVNCIATYLHLNEPRTFELNSSFVLLPKVPMKPRFHDDRIGYFRTGYLDFDMPQSVNISFMITRWRLKPRTQDEQKYLRGELVEPAKPIIYYIDPATPKKWISYLIKGVNDWQQAFEKAGFKNAIYALEAPLNDPEWSILDARHNAIVYKPSAIMNASGPNVHDPRSGEILETHINWYHNVQQLLHDWYMVQVGPNDTCSRRMVFNDELMGELIRFVVSHEVGHTLGLAHNFGASSTIPVDSLRSKNYLVNNGFCPSIMDYARFNYVAQPEDGLDRQQLLPRIGIYDEWAINWGYRWLPEFSTREQERIYMDEWITKSIKNDKRLWYGQEQPFGGVMDPRSQSEDLGDNAMKAGYYGIQNLKRVISNLMEWTQEPGADYSGLKRMNVEVINQYSRYVYHVIANIGRYTFTPSSRLQGDSIFSFIPKEKQKEAVYFLHKEVFETPQWLVNKDITHRVGGIGPNLPASIQANVLNYLFSLYTWQETPSFLYGQMALINEMLPIEERYTFNELLFDLEDGIFKELATGTPVDYFRRRLQKIYVDKLIQMYKLEISNNPTEAPFALTSDFFSIVQGHIKSIIKRVDNATSKSKDAETKLHLYMIKERLSKSLNPFQRYAATSDPNGSDLKESKPAISESGFPAFLSPYFQGQSFEKRNLENCWKSLNPLLSNN